MQSRSSRSSFYSRPHAAGQLGVGKFPKKTKLIRAEIYFWNFVETLRLKNVSVVCAKSSYDDLTDVGSSGSRFIALNENLRKSLNMQSHYDGEEREELLGKTRSSEIVHNVYKLSFNMLFVKEFIKLRSRFY